MRSLILLLIFSVSTMYSQITNAEYYFDTEPSIGNGTAIAVTTGNTINETINIDVSSLNTGFHSFYVRTKNTNNIWSLYDKNVFYISETSNTTVSNIVEAEYYYDTEPGIGNGTAITVTAANTINEVINLDITALSLGFHSFYIRTKNADNVWSLYDKNVFYISEIASTTASPIVAAEYFIDTQVSAGNGTAITLNPNGDGTFDTSIMPTGLNEGDHLLFIRVQNQDGIWSLYDVVPFTIDNDILITPLKAYLQGPLLTSTNGLLNDDLRNLNYLPTTSPYADGLTTDSTVFNTTGDNAIVDWVWIELRDTVNNIVVSQSALLQRDGDIVNPNGIDDLSFIVPAGNYFVVINHRNHLGVMSASALALSNSMNTIDFTNSAFSTYGNNAQVQLANGNMAMWAGDTSNENKVKAAGTGNGSVLIKDTVLADPSNVFNLSTFTSTGYLAIDVDLNGGGKYAGTGNDKNILKDNVLTHPSNVFNLSTYTITGTVPSTTLLSRSANQESKIINTYLPPSEEVRKANEVLMNNNH